MAKPRAKEEGLWVEGGQGREVLVQLGIPWWADRLARVHPQAKGQLCQMEVSLAP